MKGPMWPSCSAPWFYPGLSICQSCSKSFGDLSHPSVEVEEVWSSHQALSDAEPPDRGPCFFPAGSPSRAELPVCCQDQTPRETSTLTIVLGTGQRERAGLGESLHLVSRFVVGSGGEEVEDPWRELLVLSQVSVLQL